MLTASVETHRHPQDQALSNWAPLNRLKEQKLKTLKAMPWSTHGLVQKGKSHKKDESVLGNILIHRSFHDTQESATTGL